MKSTSLDSKVTLWKISFYRLTLSSPTHRPEKKAIQCCAFGMFCCFKLFYSGPESPVVQKVDKAIHWINLYPLDSTILVSLTLILWLVICPVDSAI